METTIETIFTKYKNGEVDLEPDFQRSYIWDDKKASLLIDSIINNYPIPEIFVYITKDDYKYIIVDGKQRLQTIIRFLENKFKLTGVVKFKDCKHKDLPAEIKRKFNNYKLFIREIDDSISIDEVFSRINKRPSPLNFAELMRAIYHKSPLIKEATTLANKHLKFLKDRTKQRYQHLLWILQLYILVNTNNQRGTLNPTIQRLLQSNPTYDEEFAKNLDKVFKLSNVVFKDTKFKRLDATGTPHKAHNKTVFLIQLAALWNFKDKVNKIKNKNKEIKEAFIELVNTNDRFIPNSSTSNIEILRTSIELFTRKINDIIKDSSQRAFDPSIKEKLFEAQDGICPICNDRIYDLKEAEIDHKIPFSKGGTTKIENAQLVHKYCNRSKGGK